MISKNSDAMVVARWWEQAATSMGADVEQMVYLVFEWKGEGDSQHMQMLALLTMLESHSKRPNAKPGAVLT